MVEIVKRDLMMNNIFQEIIFFVVVIILIFSELRLTNHYRSFGCPVQLPQRQECLIAMYDV